MEEGVETIDADETSAAEAADLVEELRLVLGDMLLTTRVHAESGEFHANGEGWRIEIRSETGEIAFKPAGGTLRLVRTIDDLSSVEAADRRVTFGFGDDEEITVGRGIEQRYVHG